MTNEPGLPPVIPPSGRHIVQLFLVPGLIVAGAVTILLGFSWLAGGPRSPTGLLAGLKDANPDIRWRTASDLAQVLKRDETLAADPAFALELASLLKQALADYAKFERRQAEATGDAAVAAETKAVETQLDYLQYLAACVGSTAVPVGAPVLADLAQNSPSRDRRVEAVLRRQAVWALAALGDNVQTRRKRLSADRQRELVESLELLAGTSPADQAGWARAAAKCLTDGDSLGVVDALVACAAADDPFLRKQAAMAFTFWPGTGDERARGDAALLRLARDDGHGVSERLPKEKE